MKKIIATIIAVCITLLPLSACKSDGGLTKVRLNEVTHSIFYAPLYIALENGFFAWVMQGIPYFLQKIFTRSRLLLDTTQTCTSDARISLIQASIAGVGVLVVYGTMVLSKSSISSEMP